MPMKGRNNWRSCASLSPDASELGPVPVHSPGRLPKDDIRIHGACRFLKDGRARLCHWAQWVIRSGRSSAPAVLKRPGATFASRLLLAALTVLPVSAMAETLVSNLEQTATSGELNRDGAQGFTTGTHTGGYRLDSVSLQSEDQEGDAFSAEIWTVDSDGDPESFLYSLTAPASFARGEKEFDAPSHALLEPNTAYAVVLSRTGSGQVTMGRTSSNDEDEDSLAGWSIADASRLLLIGNTWTTPGNNHAYRIAVKGVEISGNNAATGRPWVSGVARAEETLTATTGTIRDADGLTTVESTDDYTYQWLRVDGSTATPISGATGSTYTLTTADVDKKVRVRVRFADDAGWPEARESARFPVWGPVREAVTPTVPSNDRITLVANTDQADASGTALGGTDGHRAAVKFTVTSDVDYTLEELEVCVSGDNAGIVAAIREPDSSDDLPGPFLYQLVRTSPATTGNVTFSPPANATLSAGTDYLVVFDGGNSARTLCTTNADTEDDASLGDWSIADTMHTRRYQSGVAQDWTSNTAVPKLRLSGYSNASGNASGKPAIDGDTQVGSQLEVRMQGAVTDVDGYTRALQGEAGFEFQYVWIRELSNLGFDRHYTLESADVDTRLRVYVTYRDDNGTKESVSSDLSTYVLPADVLVSNLTVGSPSTDDTVEIRRWLAQAFTTGSNAQGYSFRNVKLRSADQQGDGFSVEIWSTNSDSTPKEFLYSLTPRGDFSAGVVSFREPVAAALEPDTEYTMVMRPTGGDVTMEFTGSDSTDAFSQAGWSIKGVHHWLDWLDGNTWKEATESPSPAFFIAVMGDAITGNSVATGAPWITGNARVGQTLTVTEGTIEDADGISGGYAYQWLRLDGSTATPISGATGSTYTLTTDDVGKRIKVRVRFADDAGWPEVLESVRFPYWASVREAVTPTVPSSDRITLVANTDQADASGTALGGIDRRRAAVRFTVNRDIDYTLEELEVCVSGDNEGVVAAIHDPNSSDDIFPGPLRYQLVRTSTATTGNVTFSPSANATLSAGTKYFVVVDGGDAERTLCNTRSDAEDDAGAAGWFIANSMRAQYLTDGRPQGWTEFRAIPKFRLRGDSNASGNATGKPSVRGRGSNRLAPNGKP